MDLYLEEVEVDALDEVVPHYDEIENLLTQAELEIGIGDTRAASSTFSKLIEIIEGHDISTHQQARLHTLEELLAETLADINTEDLFTGSEAAVKVITYFGEAPDGYEYVYHENPSFVGTNGLGYYVFLVPINRSESDFESVQIFFVTDQGEILAIE